MNLVLIFLTFVAHSFADVSDPHCFCDGSYMPGERVSVIKELPDIPFGTVGTVICSQSVTNNILVEFKDFQGHARGDFCDCGGIMHATESHWWIDCKDIKSEMAPLIFSGLDRDVIKSQYIAKFKDSAVQEFQDAKEFLINSIEGPVAIQQIGEFKGLTAILTDDEVITVRKFNGVEYVERDQRIQMTGQQDGVKAWGIDRSDQRTLPLDGLYTWNDASDGTGANVYILDTGIYTEHPEFGGRAHFVADCTSFSGCVYDIDPGDQNGHGTHVSGTVGSATYGIAKNVSLHSVRVLDAYGGGSFAGLLNGIALVAGLDTKKKIMSMSLTGGFNQALNEALDAAHQTANVISVVAAGNAGWISCDYSPASAIEAITVGATDSDDWRAWFSNFGPCVDIYAPGVNVLSTWNNEDVATLDGTSMSTPHVSGACALIWSRSDDLSVEDVKQTVLSEATADVVEDSGYNTPNLLLYTNP